MRKEKEETEYNNSIIEKRISEYVQKEKGRHKEVEQMKEYKRMTESEMNKIRKERDEVVLTAVSLEKKLDESQQKWSELFKHNQENTEFLEEAR